LTTFVPFCSLQLQCTFLQLSFRVLIPFCNILKLSMFVHFCSLYQRSYLSAACIYSVRTFLQIVLTVFVYLSSGCIYSVRTFLLLVFTAFVPFFSLYFQCSYLSSACINSLRTFLQVVFTVLQLIYKVFLPFGSFAFFVEIRWGVDAHKSGRTRRSVGLSRAKNKKINLKGQ
jgi:hypothetical protein